MEFVMKRRVDAWGRIVLPAEYRYAYGLASGDAVRMCMTERGLMLRRAEAGATTAVRIDELGRVAIPPRLLDGLRASPHAMLSFHAEEEGILLRTDREPETGKGL